MINYDELKTELQERYNEDMFFVNGYDEALIGVAQIPGGPYVAVYDKSNEDMFPDEALVENPYIVVYDRSKCIEIAQKEMDFEEFKMDISERYNKKMLFASGYDEALIGVSQIPEGRYVAVYDRSKCIEILQKEMSYEDAVDFFEFNTAGAYVGENTPMYLDSIEDMI